MEKYNAVTKEQEENANKRKAIYPYIDGVMVEFVKEQSESDKTKERADV